MGKSYSLFESIAVDAARQAMKLVQSASHEPRETPNEKIDGSFVTDTDLSSQRLIVDCLREATPSFSIYAEEETDTKRERGDYTWIIDPIDGTHNFYYGFPCFAIQIALEYRGKIVAAAIALPPEDLVLHAHLGGGCFANKRRVQVSKRSIKDGLLLLESRWSKTDHLLIETFKSEVHDIRVINSSCTSMSYVALGRADVLVDWDDKPWDLAAGSLLVREAGGVVTNLQGGEFDVYRPQCLATNGVEHSAVITLVKKSLAFRPPSSIASLHTA